MNNFTEMAADIRLSALTAVPNYREADCCRVLLSHLGVKRKTAGKSARPTLRAVHLILICGLINLNMHGELPKHSTTLNSLVICWLINPNMHNEPVTHHIKTVLRLKYPVHFFQIPFSHSQCPVKKGRSPTDLITEQKK